MDNLSEIIATLSPVQQKDFVFFIHRNKYRKDRKDLKLYEELKKETELPPLKLAKKIGCPNLNAYHTVRKRLFQHLSDFIVVQSSKEDASQSSHVATLISVVRYLFEKDLKDYAWKYLKLAEELASKNGFFDYLHTIYILQMEKAHLFPDQDFNKIMTCYRSNKNNLDQAEKVQLAIASLKNQLMQQNAKNESINFKVALSGTLFQLEIASNILNQPRIALDFVKTFRRIAFQTKSFLSFQTFLTHTIQQLESKNNHIPNEIAAEIRYFLAHVQFRNRAFATAKENLLKAESLFELTNPAFQKAYWVKLKQLNAALLLFSNELPAAVKELELISKQKSTSHSDHYNSLINMGIYQFLNGDAKSALKQLASFDHTDNWFEKILGTEWVMKKQLMEILLFAELQHLDLYEARTKAFTRKYNEFQQHPIYSRVFGFIKAVDLIHNAGASQPDFEKIKKHIVFLDPNEEDLQAMVFYAWLKAKATKKGFYETLLDLVNEHR